MIESVEPVLLELRRPERLEALAALRLLDRPATAAFDRLARLASSILGTSVAAVSLVDGERHLFLGASGLDPSLDAMRELPLSHSFCKHAVAVNRSHVAPDTRRDALLHDNPAVVELGIGAYAGCPLVTASGEAIGTLCVMDGEPRSWSEREVEILRELAAGVMTEMELHAARLEAEEWARRLDGALEQRTSLLRSTYEDLRRSEGELRQSRAETIARLAQAIEFRDEETRHHTERVSEYCFLLAEGIGLPAEACELLRTAAPLHDIGKIAIPDGILMKPGVLTGDQRRVMETHAEIGHRVLAGSSSKVLDVAATVAWTHHERVDGSGYPRGLAGAEIPLEGRITAVADVFDALVTRRPYRAGLPLDEAFRRIEAGAGRHFDAEVAAALLRRRTEVVKVHRRRQEPAGRSRAARVGRAPA